MKLYPIVIGLILASGAMLGMQLYYNEIVTVYAPTNATSSAVFLKFNETFDRMNTLSADIENHTGTFTITDLSTYGDGFLAFLSIIGLVFQVPGMIIDNLAVIFGIIAVPEWFKFTINAVVTITIAFIVASIVLKREEL